MTGDTAETLLCDTIWIAISRKDIEAMRGVPALASVVDRYETMAASIEDYGADIDRAKDEYANDDVNVEDFASVSPSDGGTWVAAWVWVGRDEGEDEDEEG